MPKALEESITDVDMAVDRQENTRGIIVQQGDIAEGTAATRTPYQGPTAHQMLTALEESIADAMDVSMDGGNIEPGDAGKNTASARSSRSGSPVSDDDNNQPSTQGRTQPSRGTSPKPPTPSQSKRILTYPNGPNMPPLNTYIHTPPPPPPPQPRSPSPRSSYNIRIAPPSNTIHIPLPLAPTPDRPGLVLQSPSRSQSPPSSPVDQWNHQPPGFDSLVPRGGGYREGSIERWPNLPERVVERMRKGGLEVRGEEVVVRAEEGEEGQDDGEEDEGGGDGGGGSGADDVGLDEGEEGVGVIGTVRQWSEVSSAGDPADTTMSELDSLLEGY
ncbi:MAG: hypothetical protein L6R42_008216 [Xanthoria sp. 1 TBL-2021]|nr:MAG: hypothetical protein L6R42_008216 [Xanthoria sp. 1 TBL-2021]